MHVYGVLHNTTDMSKKKERQKRNGINEEEFEMLRDLRSYSVYSGGNMQKARTRAGEEGETDKHVKKKS